MRRPPALFPGAHVRVVAPSSPFDVPLAWRGLGWLASRYHVHFDRGLFDVHHYLAGPDSRRAAELQSALQDPTTRAIVAVRGGYGANRFAHLVDWDALRATPKWIVGFSDITALHVEAAATGVMSMHATMVAQLGRGDANARDRWLHALESPASTTSWTGLRTVRTGNARGPLFGGNLAMLHACAAAGRLRLPTGAVLLLEDVGERPYRVDRMLTTLIVGGHLSTVRGVVLGEFLDCLAGTDGAHVNDVLQERLQTLGVPIAACLPVGHGSRNDPIVLGADAELNATGATASLIVRAEGA